MSTYQSNIKTALRGGLLTLVTCCLLSCGKQDEWLDVKSTKSSVTPATLNDLQAILNNGQVMNNLFPISGLLGSDNVFITDASLDAIAVADRNTYLWQKDIYQGGSAADWIVSYQAIEYANIVLDGLDKLSAGEQGSTVFANVKGSALFYRAFAFYNLSQLYCKPYDSATAASDPGIPLRMTSDVNERTTRATVQDGYDRVLADLKQALDLLPASPLYRTQPSGNAVKFLLAKVFLSMQNYPEAAETAGQLLSANSRLIDFKTLNAVSTQPFPSFATGNPEIVFYANALGNSNLWPLSSTGRVSPELYRMYDDHDLRKKVFYAIDSKNEYYRFKATYGGDANYNFAGLALNELYLICAEAKVRTGKPGEALQYLNTLLSNRYDATFKPLTITDSDLLLSTIITEKRKELPFTGNIRWEDLRRLNLTAATAATLRRTYKGQSYQLVPNSPLYTLPIPQNEIELSGIPQNPR